MRRLRADEPIEVDGGATEDSLEEEEKRTERLILGRGGYVPVSREVRQKPGHLRRSEPLQVVPTSRARVAHEAPHPGEVSLLRPGTVVPRAKRVAHHVRELPLTPASPASFPRARRHDPRVSKDRATKLPKRSAPVAEHAPLAFASVPPPVANGPSSPRFRALRGSPVPRSYRPALRRLGRAFHPSPLHDFGAFQAPRFPSAPNRATIPHPLLRANRR